MNMILREAKADDAATLGGICYRAFATISDSHGFVRDFESPEAAIGLMTMLIEHPGFHGVAAELDGRLVGSNFVDERSSVTGLGPITVDPDIQNQGVGRRLMQHMTERTMARHAAGLRLVQMAYHNRSLSLYTTLGYRTREPLSVMQGTPPGVSLPGYTVRAAQEGDLAACNDLCRQVHGFDRARELREASEQGSALVVEHLGKVSGYSSLPGFFGHTVARTNHDLIAMIAAAPAYPGPGFLLPTRNFEVFSWCLANGLRLVAQAHLMTMGLYNEPGGAYMPSILY